MRGDLAAANLPTNRHQASTLWRGRGPSREKITTNRTHVRGCPGLPTFFAHYSLTVAEELEYSLDLQRAHPSATVTPHNRRPAKNLQKPLQQSSNVFLCCPNMSFSSAASWEGGLVGGWAGCTKHISVLVHQLALIVLEGCKNKRCLSKIHMVSNTTPYQ